MIRKRHDRTIAYWVRISYVTVLLTCALSTICYAASVDVGHAQPAASSSAKPSTDDKAPPPAATPATYKPPQPNPKDFDWVRLTSGEWLKGDITLMRDDKFEFDSDELGDLKLDWKDIAELHSPRRNTYLFEGRTQVTGTLLLRDGIVVVGGETEQRFKREKLLAIIPGEATEFNFWSGKLSAGFTRRSGNTDQTDVTGHTFARRETLLTRLHLEYRGNFGTLDGDENVNNHRFTNAYDLLVTRRFFVRPFASEIFRDPFQNIAVRFTPGAGVGYYLFKRSDFKWEVTFLAGWQYTRFDSVESGSKDEANAAVIFGTKVEKDLTSKIDATLDYRLQSAVPDVANNNHHLEAIVSMDVIGDLDFDLTFVWDRVGDPEPDSSGDLPKKNDFRFFVGLGLTF
jgi:hypothetical protein